jgi:surfeit locus 1 family protein
VSKTRTVTSKANGARGDAARPSSWLTVLSLAAFALLMALGVWLCVPEHAGKELNEISV